MREDFFSAYLSYIGDSEVPTIFHRWCAITGVGAYIGRNYQLNHGHFLVNPNVYCMLIGDAGTRKSSSIKIMKSILQQAGYTTIAADKTTKEKFMLDLAGVDADATLADNLLDSNLFGEDTNCDMLVAADEFNDFCGHGNLEFLSLLGVLWDYNGVYKNRIKNGTSVSINNPTVSILGGNTPTGFAMAFPPDIIGQGFFSRILLIQADRTKRRITFPVAPDPIKTKEIVDNLIRIKSLSMGNAILTPEAVKLLDAIYVSYKGIDDVRFESYTSRRFTHLLKLCLIHSAGNYHATHITEDDVVYANTVLTHTEHFMAKALGEFGRAKDSAATHKVVQILEASDNPITMPNLYTLIRQDVNGMPGCTDIVRNLIAAGKIQNTAQGLLPVRKAITEDSVSSKYIDMNYLTQEEREMKR